MMKGTVTDEENKPLEFVNVFLKQDSIAINNTITDSAGFYKFAVSVNKNYRIKFSLIGYADFDTIVFVEHHQELNIRLKINATSLSNVTITSQKPLIERKVDRLVFNVENSIAATGGDAMDALRVTPNVRVTEDNISIVGKGKLLVLIDGREMHLSGNDLVNYLKSISSDNIKSIEVITTPPAKYEAEGNAGILNIILKKTKNNSWNLALRTGVKKADDWSFSEGATFMLQKGKWSIMAGIPFYQNTFLYTNDIRYKYTDEYWKNGIFNFTKGAGFYPNLNVGYKISDKLQIGLQYTGGGGNQTTSAPINKNYTEIYDNEKMLSLNKLYQLDGITDLSSYNHSLNFNLEQKLDTLGKKISFDADYFVTENDKENPFYTNNFYYNPPSNEQQYFTQNNSHLKIDFEMPYKWATLNYGGKISFTNDNSATSGDFYQIINHQNNLYLTQKNDFIYKENNEALYFSAEKKWSEKWTAKTGLRFEATQTEGISKPKDETPQTNKTNYEKLFPTAYLSYKSNDHHTFSVSYNKRIERPDYLALDPAKWYQSLNSVAYGNPFIQPNFINSFSVNHQFKDLLTSEISYYTSANEITQIIRHENGSVYFQHDNWADNSGFSISETLNRKITKWWTTASGASTSFNKIKVFKNLVNEGLYQSEYKNWGGVYFYSNHSFNLNKPKTFTAQADFSFNTKGFQGEGYFSPFGELDLGLKYAMMNNKLQLALYANDIFFTSPIVFHSTISGIQQSFHQTYDSRFVRFTITYKLGNNNISIKSREGSNTEEKSRAR